MAITLPFEDSTDPAFITLLASAPFRWQGDIGVQNWCKAFAEMASAPAAAPTLTSVNPNTATAGAADTVVTLTGTGFVTGAVVVANATDLVTTFVSATELSATIPAADMAAAATIQISVRNPDAQVSAQVPFTVS